MKKIEILGKRYYVLTEEETHNVHGSAARIISSDLMVEIIAILYGLTLSFPYTGNSYFELSDKGERLNSSNKTGIAGTRAGQVI